MNKQMNNNSKTDPQLGLMVHEHLVSKGLESPMIFDQLAISSETKCKKLVPLFKKMLEILGFDLEDDSLIETPQRMAKMYAFELLSGMSPDNFPKCTTVENKMHYDEMIVENDVSVMSLCEHHLVVIDGKASVAYIPKKKVLGLSKIPRIVSYFSKRGQIQERLTQQIHETLKFILETDDVAVVIKAKHYCVASRGVKDINAFTTTSAVSGCFRDSSAKVELLKLIQ